MRMTKKILQAVSASCILFLFSMSFGDTLFSDGFEDCFTNWTSNAFCSASYYEGLKSCKLDDYDYAEAAIDTQNFATVQVSYVRKTSGLASGDSFISEWYDGSTWHTIEDITSGFTSWTVVSQVALPSAAAGNLDFKIRFRVITAGSYAYVDSIAVEGDPLGPDTDPPTPDPMTWQYPPYASSTTTITMTATTATDRSGAEYYFACTSGGGNDSGWQASPTYKDKGLSPDTTYTYTVTARDATTNIYTTAASASASATTLPGSASRPNIVYIITDQQFADAISCYAGTTWLNTPAMDSIAQGGVRFTNAYVNYPVCMPHRYSMFTGRLACTRAYADPANKPLISLGNQAKQAGYDTAYFGKWHIQDDTFTTADTVNHGFDICQGGRDDSTAGNAISYLSQRPGDPDPFFAVFSFYNPHDICEWGRIKSGYPDEMLNGYVDIYAPLSVCPPLPDNYEINPDEAEAVTVRRSLYNSDGTPNAQLMAMSWTQKNWRQYRWAYNRLVEYVDTDISVVLQALEDNGLTDNTVIIFASDHGDGYGAHRWHQKSILYDESCRVPFIIKHPGSAARKNQTDDRLVSVGIDLMATVSDLVGVDMPDGPYYGKSVLPFVFDENSIAPTHEYVVIEAAVGPDTGPDYEGRSVRTAQFKYHLWSYGANREQLFDMINDPGETTNLATDSAYTQVLQQHRDLFFEQWLENTDDDYAGDPLPPLDLTPLAAPTGLVATAGVGAVSLDWADNSEIDLASYSVYRSTTSGSYDAAIAAGVGSSAYVDNTAANGTTYYYVVTAVDNAANNSGYSNEDSALPPDLSDDGKIELDDVVKLSLGWQTTYDIDTLAAIAECWLID